MSLVVLGVVRGCSGDPFGDPLEEQQIVFREPAFSGRLSDVLQGFLGARRGKHGEVFGLLFSTGFDVWAKILL